MARKSYIDLLREVEEEMVEKNQLKAPRPLKRNSYDTFRAISNQAGVTAPIRKKKKEEEEKITFGTKEKSPLLEVPTVEEAITKFKPKEEAWYNNFFDGVKGVGSSLAYGVTEGIGALGTVVKENLPSMLSNKVSTRKALEDYEATHGITPEKKEELLNKYIKEYGDGNIDVATTKLAEQYSEKAEKLKLLGGLGQFQNPEEYAQLEKEVAEIEYARDVLQEKRGRKPFTDDIFETMKATLDFIGLGEAIEGVGDELATPFDQVEELGENTVGTSAQKFGQEHSFVGGLAQSIGGLIPAMVATALTKNTAVGSAVFTASAKGGYYENYVERGYTRKEAEEASTLMAGVELGTEFLGGWLGGVNVFKSGALKEIAEKSGVQTIKALGVEGIEEATAELANIGIDMDLGEDITLEEAGERIGTAFASGVALGVVMKGAGVAGSKAQALAQKINNNEQVTETELVEALEEVAEQENTTVEALLENEITEMQQNTEQETVKEQENAETEKIEAPQAEISDFSEQEQQVTLPEVETAQNNIVEPNTAIDQEIAPVNVQNVAESEENTQKVAESEEKKQIQVYNAVRLDEKNANLDAEAKPHGLFLSNLYETDFNEFESPFARQYEGGERHHYKVEPKNPLVVKPLTLDNAKYKYRGGGQLAWLDADASVSALKELVGEQEFTKVSEMSKQELIDYLNNKYSQYDFSNYYDKAELLMAYGSVEARNQGYDAIITERSTDPDTADIDNEIVVLKNDILKTEAEQDDIAPVKAAQTTDDITIENEVNDFHSGETFSTMTAKVDGKVVGTLEYSEYKGEPSVKMVEVSPEYRRKGVGTKLLQELQKAYPNTEIDFGMLTDDGAKLIEKSTYTVENREIANKMARRDVLQEKIDEYDKTIEESHENDTELPEGYAADYNEIYDELQDLNEELRGKKATKRLVRETPTAEEIDNIIKLKDEGGQKYAKAYYDAVDKYGHTAFYKAMNEGYVRAKNQDIAPVKEVSKFDNKGRKLTKEQQEFFKDVSPKVKDENGNLLTLYHGSRTGGFTIFDKNKMGKGATVRYNVGDGFYFTDSGSDAVGYSKIEDGRYGQLYEVYLNLTNPFVIEDATFPSEQRKVLSDFTKMIHEKHYDEIKNGSDYKIYDGGDIGRLSPTGILVDAVDKYGSEFTQYLQSIGYDGLIHDTTKEGVKNYIAFEPNQIKSVDNLNPTSNPDIRELLDITTEQVEETIAPLQETISELTEQVGKLTDLVENAVLNNATLAENVADTTLDQQVEANNEPTGIVEDTTPDIDSDALLNEMMEVQNENGRTETTSKGTNTSELRVKNEASTRELQEKVSRGISKYKKEIDSFAKETIRNEFAFNSRVTKAIVDKISTKERLTEQDIIEAFEGYREIKLPNKELDAQEQAIKSYFKDKRINIGKLNKSDINAGEFNDFRRKHQGRTYFVLNGGEAADQVYHELNAMYPNVFPDTVWNTADQIELMGDVLEGIYRPPVETIELTDADISRVAKPILDGYETLDYMRNELTKKYTQELNEQAELASLEATIPIADTQFLEEATADFLAEDETDIPIAENTAETATEDEETVVNNRHEKIISSNTTETSQTQTTVEPTAEPTNTIHDDMINNTITRMASNIATMEASGYGANRSEKAKKTFIEKAKSTLNTLQDLMVNRSRAIDQLAKQVGNPAIKHLNDRLNNITAEVGGEINFAQTDLEGRKIGEAMITPFLEADKVGLREDFNYYLTHVVNVERSARDKGLGGIDGVTSAEIVKAYEQEHPEFIQWKNMAVTYERNGLYNDVAAGMVDKPLADQLIAMYPNYLPYHFDIEPTFVLSPDEIRAGKTVKTAEGGGDITKIIPIEEAMATKTSIRKHAQIKNLLLAEIAKSQPAVMEFDLGNTQASELGETVFTDASGKKYATAYIDGKAKTFEISEDLYNAFNNDLDTKIKELEEKFELITKPLQTATTIFGKMNTTWSLTFPITNPIKDMFDAPLNSKHTARWLGNAASGRALLKIKNNDATWQQFKSLYGTDTLQQEYGGGVKTEKIGKNIKFLNKIGNFNQFVEMYPRYIEFLSSLEAGNSTTEALYNAREVTTNFGRGGTIAKAINRNGVAFYNVSIQGFDKLIRNFSGENGAMGIVKSLAKVTALGMLPAVFNHLLFGDDEEYEELSDYVKDNYYLIKLGDGNFFRIPKGRMISVFGSAARRTLEMAEGEENAFDGYLTNAWTQVGFSNPITDNIFAGVIDVANNETWYGSDLIPTRLQDEAPEEQYDESTDEFSKWLGEQIGVSPIKTNYLLDQYGGSIADIVLPMITDEAKSDKEGFLGTIGSIFTNKFTSNSTFNNKYVSEFYDTKDKVGKIPESKATEEEKLQAKYLNDVGWELSDLYKKKREIQSSLLDNAEKYKAVEKVQREIDDISKAALEQYKDIDKSDNYAVIGNKEYYKKDNTWTKVKDKDLEDVNGLGLTTKEKGIYFNTKTELGKLDSRDEKETYLYKAKLDKTIKTAIYENSVLTSFEKEDSNKAYKTAKAVGVDIDTWLDFEKQTFYANKDKNGESISGTKKNKVISYINSLDLSIPQKAIMIRTQYETFDTYNNQIVSYVSDLNMSYAEKVEILENIGMKVDSNGYIKW